MSTQTPVLNPEVGERMDERNSDQTIRTTVNGVNHSLSSPLESFAQEALDNAKTISDFFRGNDLPHPSFARDALPNAFLSAPENIVVARARLTEAALRLFQLARGSQEYISNLSVNVKITLRSPQGATLMISGAIYNMPPVAYPFFYIPAGATGRHDFVSGLGEPS